MVGIELGVVVECWVPGDCRGAVYLAGWSDEYYMN
jgi:hypothetical protein